MEHCGRRTIGPIIDEIKKEIRSTITGWPDICAAYGFGSFFRSEPFNDIDVLLVVQPVGPSSLRTYYNLKTAFDGLSERFGIQFDITVLTEREFSERPLRDMDSLVPIDVNARPVPDT